MKDLIKRFKLFLQRNFNFLYRFYLEKVTRIKFKKEINFFENQHQDNNKILYEKKSILFFTSHKCASTFFDNFFNLIKKCQKRECINVDQYNTFILKNKFNDSDKFLSKFQNYGYIFGPIRTFLNIPNLHNYEIILFLRDPRDVLVSDFFSTKFSHNIINQELISEKKIIQNKSINEFALWKYEYYKKKYEAYIHLLNLKNVIYIRYNDFIEKPQEIKDKLLKIFEINFLTKELEYIFKQNILEYNREKIDLYSHKKMGYLNIYKNHLNEETIKYLNEQFKEIIKKFRF